MKKSADTTLAISADYRQFVEELKARVISARISAARAITHEAILLYWDIGRGIVEKQKEHGWGDSVVEIVADEIGPSLRWASAQITRNERRGAEGGPGAGSGGGGGGGSQQASRPASNTEAPASYAYDEEPF